MTSSKAEKMSDGVSKKGDGDPNWHGGQSKGKAKVNWSGEMDKVTGDQKKPAKELKAIPINEADIENTAWEPPIPDKSSWFNEHQEEVAYLVQLAVEKDEKIGTMLTESLAKKDPEKKALFLYELFRVSSRKKTIFLMKKTLDPILETEKEFPIPVEVKDAVFYRFFNTKHWELVSQLYDLFEITDGERYKSSIEKFAVIGYYQNACSAAVKFKLFDEFDFRLFCLPLFIQHNFAQMDLYLEKSPKAARDLMDLLDSLCFVSTNAEKVQAILETYKEVKPSHAGKLSGKVLEKSIRTYCTKLNIPPCSLPIFYMKTSEADIRYWTKSFYEDDQTNNHLTKEGWRELMIKKVEGFDKLKEKLLKIVSQFDHEETRYLSAQLNCRPDYLMWILEPSKNEESEEEDWGTNNNAAINDKSVKGDEPKDNKVETQATDAQKENGDKRQANDGQGPTSGNHPRDCASDKNEDSNPDHYHELALHIENVVMVDTLESFNDFLEKMRGETMVGFDAEHMTTHLVPRVSLVQIANKSHAYLLDIDVLNKELNDDNWCRLKDELFCRKDLTIVGYDLRGDFKLLSKTIPVLADVPKDLQICTKAIGLELLKAKLKFTLDLQETTLKGLSGLTQIILGKPLDKREQISDWSKRPLRDTQKVYAALDAYVVLEIFEKMKAMCEDRDMMKEFNEAVVEVKTGRIDKSSRRMASVKSVQEDKTGGINKSEGRIASVKHTQVPTADTHPPILTTAIAPNQLRVICDSMLQGLCKTLRMCGVDAKSLDSHNKHEDCLTVVERDNNQPRPDGVTPLYVLSSGSIAQKLSKSLPKGHCLRIKSDNAEDQVLEVFKYFNVKPQEGDIFSRCVICNGPKYLKASSRIMLRLLEEQLARENPTSRVSMDPEALKLLEDNPLDEKQDPYDYTDASLGAFRNEYELGQDDDEDIPFAPVSEWENVEGGRINMKTGKTDDGVLVDVRKVPRDVLEKYAEFWICGKCGKVYWQGSHWQRTLSAKKRLLGVAKEPEPELPLN